MDQSFFFWFIRALFFGFSALLQALLKGSSTVEGYVRAFHLTWCRLCDRGVDENGVDTDDLQKPQLAFRATLCCCAVKLEVGDAWRGEETLVEMEH